MFKRFGLWMMMNLAVIITISIVMSLLGVEPYLTQYGLNYQALMIFCLIWGIVGSFISLSMSKFMAKKFMGVKVVEPHSQFSSLVNTVHTLARAANLPKMPEVGIYESPEVNAFATGPSKSRSLVAVSSGLLQNLNNEELEGVLAHEVAHIANGDMVTMTLVQGVVNAFVMFFARIAAFALQQALRSDDDDSPIGGLAYMFTTIAFEIFFGFFGMFITSWFSRVREYSADIGGAQLAGKNKMIAALKKLQAQYENGVIDKRNQNMNAFKISSKEVGIRALISTHPKLADRIQRLEQGQY
jgi:heat shock protein HtpX